jgi:4-hydroxy-tetrahydrodipicolinate synthase
MNKYIDQITGPVIPLPTPFKQNGEIDTTSLESYVRFLVDQGIKNLMTTVGTSRYNLLSNEEIKLVNETVVAAAEGKAYTIVANPPFGRLEDAVDFAKHSEAIGASLFLAYYPERYYGDEYLIDFFKALSDAVDIGILIHEMPMRNGLGGGSVQYSIPLLKKLLQLENIVGVKEEALDIAYSNAVVKAISSEAVIIGAGGGMSRYLRDYWLGAKAFLGGIGNFHPALELDFYTKMTSKQFEEAHDIVLNIEQPFFGEVVSFGWHPSLKSALSLCGHMQAYERKPMKQTTDAEREHIKKVLQDNKWL